MPIRKALKCKRGYAFATNARQQSDLETAQQVLGHSSKQTTERRCRYSVKLAFKLKGLAADEVTPDCTGIGSLNVPAVQDPVPTLRERCESLQYRQELLELLERFKLFGAVCSVEAAMALTAISERAGVDQTDFLKLFKHCAANGFTAQTFRDACEELSALDAIEIFRNRHSQLVVKVKRVVDSATSLRVADVIGCLPVAAAEVVEAA